MRAEVANHQVEKDLPQLAARERNRKQHCAHARHTPSQWRSPGERDSYASKLLDALRRATPSPSTPPRSRAIREAADRVLATAARGRTRWSRAIIANYRAIKLRRKRRAVTPGCARLRKPGSSPPAGKAKVLGRLVPGCRRLSLPSLLEEASDYIAALEMQVRVMSALTEVLSFLDGSAAQRSRLCSGSSSSTSS